MDRHQQALTIDFINRSFRDVADQDYIAARICHRFDLTQQFLWAALQSVEKYLKAILLYNGRSTKRLGHKAHQAYKGLKLIGDIDFRIPTDVQNFIQYLEGNGANRYFEYPYATTGDELLLLDKTVWYVRRYCRPFDRSTETINGRTVCWLEVELKNIHAAYYQKRPNRLRVTGGLLESILDKKQSPLRTELIWKNFWYGRHTKHVVRNIRMHSASGNPAHYLHPEIFEELRKRVQFSPAVIDYFSSNRVVI